LLLSCSVGTDRGVTAIQLDVKLPGGVPLRILDEALLSAKEGRLHILRKMQKTLPQARHSVKPQAPKAEYVRYDVDRKGMLIGPRGDMLRYMEELYNVTLDLNTQEGVAYIFGPDATNVAACSKLVQDIAVLVKEGDTVTATVTSVMDYGMVVTINRAQQALLHVSDLSHDQALLRKPVAALVKPGQRFNVKVRATFLRAFGTRTTVPLCFKFVLSCRSLLWTRPLA
jgi:polyribonucleotide nucleotidyltransferase